ncbi:MAG: hypothetical protein KGI80_02290, partial [Verrucomicrobiota bacterium]|nr:hypothetical protein [Verrucomicrobiota bacterium]
MLGDIFGLSSQFFQLRETRFLLLIVIVHVIRWTLYKTVRDRYRYRISYDAPIPGKKAGSTTVVHPDGATTVYRFNALLLLEAVENWCIPKQDEELTTGLWSQEENMMGRMCMIRMINLSCVSCTSFPS